jgi:hypothetical protein
MTYSSLTSGGIDGFWISSNNLLELLVVGAAAVSVTPSRLLEESHPVFTPPQVTDSPTTLPTSRGVSG